MLTLMKVGFLQLVGLKALQVSTNIQEVDEVQLESQDVHQLMNM